MIFKSKIRRRVAMAVTAAALAIGGVVAVSVPAQAIAALTFDTFPDTPGVSYYYSSDSPSGAKANNGDITWYNDQGSVSVDADLYDTRADGHGPVLRIQLCFSDHFTNCVYKDFHETAGNGTWDHFLWSSTTQNYINDYSTVVIEMCNGYNSNGAPLNCSELKGPFHRY